MRMRKFKRRFSKRRKFSRKKRRTSHSTRIVRRAVRAIGRPELKYDDQTFTLFTPTVATAYTTNLHRYLIGNVTQGTGATSLLARIGNTILLRGVSIKFTVTINPTVSSIATTYRCMLVLDKQPNGAAFNTGDLIESNATVDNMVVSPFFRNYNRRFKILKDKTYTIDCDVKGASAEQQVRKHLWLKKLYLPIRYTDTNIGTIADINTNALWFIIWPYNYDPAGPPTSQNNLICNLWIRTWFTDV